MRFLSHNSLRCNAKDVAHGYPLQIEIESLEVRESEFNKDFIACLLPTLEWRGVLVAAAAVGLEGLPLEFNTSLCEDHEMLQAMHNLLLDMHVTKGVLICSESGRRFPIINSIPNMM